MLYKLIKFIDYDPEDKKKVTCWGVHPGLMAVWWGSECLKGETRQLFGIPFPKDKWETDITEYERVFFFFPQQSNKKKRFSSAVLIQLYVKDQSTELILT